MNTVTTFTWWGSSTIEIRRPERTLAIDPYLNPQTDVDYVCVTHQDFDHCYDPTLRALTSGPRFEHLFIPKSCTARTRLDSPVHDRSVELDFVPPEKCTVLYPKITRERGANHAGPVEAEVDGFRIETVDSSERPERFWSDAEVLWPDGAGPFVAPGEFPQLGYLISDLHDTTFFHPGDLHEAFDNLRLLRGRVDYMFFPAVKLEGVELTVIDAVRPRFIVPIHYRADTPGFPVPLDISQDQLTALDLDYGSPRSGTDLDTYRREFRALMDAHWYPTGRKPLERLAELAEAFEDIGSKLLIVEAGTPHTVEPLMAA